MNLNYPDIVFFTSFNYETLLGNGYLTGKAEIRESSLSLVSEYEQNLDVIGITYYPFFDYTSPLDIPKNYYEPLSNFSKPAAFTEIGWLTRDNFEGN